MCQPNLPQDVAWACCTDDRSIMFFLQKVRIPIVVALGCMQHGGTSEDGQRMSFKRASSLAKTGPLRTLVWQAVWRLVQTAAIYPRSSMEEFSSGRGPLGRHSVDGVGYSWHHDPRRRITTSLAVVVGSPPCRTGPKRAKLGHEQGRGQAAWFYYYY